MGRIGSVSEYALLGRSGLRVSPLCLGTMTFGTEWGWGSEEGVARQVLDRYLEAGGNFIDTADLYTNGRSEELLGKFLSESGRRDEVVLATKFTFNARPGDPNAGGNGRKNIMRALEGSLRRLKTDYVDLYWLHAWDTLTPAEEVVSTLDGLVKAGKIRYYGLSDVPAWYYARVHTLAEARGMERPIALQLEYSLIERAIEREHVPAALELGAGICPWSPLGAGLLTGKYQKTDDGMGTGPGRLEQYRDPTSALFRFKERNWPIAEAVVAVARELGRSPAQVALNWITKRPGVSSTIIGASKLEQLEDNLTSLEFELPAALWARLEEATRPPVDHPYTFFRGATQERIKGGTTIHREPRWFR